MKRYIYAFDSAESAHAAVMTLRLNGIDEQCMSLIARADIQLEKIPEKYLDASSDFMPALGRSAAIAGITGLFAGLVAMAIPATGIAIGGSALLHLPGNRAGSWHCRNRLLRQNRLSQS